MSTTPNLMKEIINKSATLSNNDIANFIYEVNDFLEQKKRNTTHAKKTMFLIEEALLNWQSYFGESKECILTFSKKRNKYLIDIKIEGEANNPFEIQDELFEQIFIPKSDIEPEYTYKRKTNILSCKIKKETNVFGILVAASLIGGIAFGLILNLLPPTLIESITYVFNKISSSVLGLLSMTAGPLIFFAITSAIIGLDKASGSSKVARKTVVQFILCDIIFMSVILLSSFFVFPINYQTSGNIIKSKESFTLIVDTIFNIIPTNFLGCFIDQNFLQILLIAIIIGIASLKFTKIYPKISDVAEAGVSILSKVMQWFVYLLPLVIFITIATNISSGNFVRYANIWILAAYIFSFMILCFFTYLIIVSLKTKLQISYLLKKILPILIVSLLTGSSTTVLTEIIDSLNNYFNMDKNYARFSASSAIVFFVPDSIIIFAASIFYGAMLNGNISIDLSWIITLFIMCILFGIAAPPIVGGYAAILGIMFTNFGIDSTLIGVIVPLIIIFDYICTGIKVGILQLDIILEASKLKMITNDCIVSGNNSKNLKSNKSI